MRAHAQPKNPAMTKIRLRLLRLALSTLRAKEAAKAAAAAKRARQEEAARRRKEKRKQTAASKKTKKPMNASLADDPFKLKMKVKLEPLQVQYDRRKKVAEKNFCGRCSKSFSTASGLRRHLTTIHANTKKKSSKKQDEYKPTPRASTSSQKNTEDSLTCKTCDKTFVARSIFERHMKTSGHGEPQTPSSSSSSWPPPAFVGPNVPHLNAVVQPKMEVGGVEVNKYECHLCNSVFLRIKDLARHRERQCTAWSNVGK